MHNNADEAIIEVSAESGKLHLAYDMGVEEPAERAGIDPVGNPRALVPQ